MIMSERMFVIVGAFLFGYFLGYYSFELIKSKNRKNEIHEFFLSYNKKYGSDYIFLGNNLSYEEKFWNSVIEKIKQEIEDCEVSYFLNKKFMTICCESLTINEKIARKLLKLADWLMDEDFFQKNGLREIGCCTNYMLDRRSASYCKIQQVFKKTEIVEFYWFNNSPNRFAKQQFVTEVELCNCMHCHFFMH